MGEINQKMVKDLGLQRKVLEALPYAVVGATWMGSFTVAVTDPSTLTSLLNHIVPNGQQLKMLFLRIWTQSEDGAKFRIIQTNPGAIGLTGTVEAYPVVGSVPQGVRDYPMLEAAGAEVLRGSLVDPVHVFEGSIEFQIYGPIAATGDRYAISWWGVEKTAFPK